MRLNHQQRAGEPAGAVRTNRYFYAANLRKYTLIHCELAAGFFAWVVAETLGYARIYANQCSNTPPLDCAFAIYYRTSEESLAMPGVVYPRMSDPADPRVEEPLRETQVLQHIAQGLSDREIAESLQLSVRTGENHAARIRKKPQIDNRTALVRYALRARLIEP